MTPAALRVCGGIGVLLAIAAASAAGPPVLGLWPEQPDFLAALGPPSLAHPMGTDDLGRDVLARAGALVARHGVCHGRARDRDARDR